MEYLDKAKELVSQMTLEEKASLCSGLDFWHTKGVSRLGLESVMVTDGPHGLRKQDGESDHLGINNSVPATCFPAACATACSFDTDLMREIGEALGEECLQEDVAVILGPAVNIKRSPLCGRNFEYVSEDPLLTGKMAGSLVTGIQSKGIGTSVKHYAVNNQETRRMSSNSVVDDRALREIYLAGYEKIVRETQPWTMMCSYNLVNGTYASDNKWLLTDVLRDEWGFEGLVMTDWGAMNDRVQGVRAGLDLEMPGSRGINDAKIVKAVQDGLLKETELDIVAGRVTAMVLQAVDNRRQGYTYDADAHHALARRAAADSSVLLKNGDQILPLAAGTKVAVIGAFAKTPRYQGAGSSKINPLKMDNAFDELTAAGLQTVYAEGYSLKPGSKPDDALIEEACAAAKEADVAVVFAGLPDEYESEGYDRSNMRMPDSHNRLISEVAASNPNTVVVLLLGAPVETPWVDQVKGVLVAYLGGQAGGGACADILTGKVNPSGKLAESWPVALEDNPSHLYFPGGNKSVEYRESIFVGYRYYDTVDKTVRWPFGYGMSYSSFDYSDLAVGQDEDGGTRVSFTVTNTGKLAGAETAQLYVAAKESQVFRPRKELKGFDKIYLEPGENRQITLSLDQRSFAYYDSIAANWIVEGGTYTVQVAASSRDIRLSADIQIAGDGQDLALAALRDKTPIYWDLPKGSLVIETDQFASLYGKPLPASERTARDPYNANSTLKDIQHTKVGQQILKMTKENVTQMMGEGEEDLNQMVDAMMMDMPLRLLMMLSGGSLTQMMLDGIVNMLNGRMLKGLIQMQRGTPKKK